MTFNEETADADFLEALIREKWVKTNRFEFITIGFGLFFCWTDIAAFWIEEAE